jgi:hypothetical protein
MKSSTVFGGLDLRIVIELIMASSEGESNFRARGAALQVLDVQALDNVPF